LGDGHSPAETRAKRPAFGECRGVSIPTGPAVPMTVPVRHAVASVRTRAGVSVADDGVVTRLPQWFKVVLSGPEVRTRAWIACSMGIFRGRQPRREMRRLRQSEWASVVGPCGGPPPQNMGLAGGWHSPHVNVRHARWPESSGCAAIRFRDSSPKR
jgi:hypothetical protein